MQRAALAEPQRDVADRLVAARLVVADDSEGGQTLRLAHEALLGHWPRLAGLTAEHRDFLIVRRRLQADASSWEGHDRHDDFLLPPGRRLAEAEDVLSRRRADLGPEIVAYVEASIAANCGRLAAAQQAKERELRRELQRSRRIAAMVSMLLLLALCGGAVAWWQRGVAAAALGEAVKNYRLALDQAAGSVQLLTDSYAAGAISTKLMQQLIQQSQKTVNGLPGETEDVTAARAQLFDVLSLAHAAVGDTATAQKFAESEVGLVEGLVSKSPGDARWARLRALAQGRLADALFWKGDSRGPCNRRGLRRKPSPSSTSASIPTMRYYSRVLATPISGLFSRCAIWGDLDAAAEEHRAWVAYAEALVARRLGSLKPLASLAGAYQEYGDTLQQQGNAPQAAVQYQAAVTAAAQLVEKDPENAGYLATLTISHERVGDALLAQGNMTSALAEYRRALDLADELSDVDPVNFQWRELLEATHQRVGEVLLKQKDFKGALAEFQTYLSLAEDMRRRVPANGSAPFDVANALEKMGDVLREQGDLAGALRYYVDSHKAALELNSKGWSNSGWQKLLAMSYQRIGMTLEAQGDDAGALSHFRQCAAIPVKNSTWSPRMLWPADVVQYCRQEVAQRGG